MAGADRRADVVLGSCVTLSIALVVAALVDQTVVHSLGDHVESVYADEGIDAPVGPLYVALYALGVVATVAWSWLLWSARVGRPSARWGAVTTSVLTGVAAVVILTAAEYGERIFGVGWGLLALVPALLGLATWPLLKRR